MADEDPTFLDEIKSLDVQMDDIAYRWSTTQKEVRLRLKEYRRGY